MIAHFLAHTHDLFGIYLHERVAGRADQIEIVNAVYLCGCCEYIYFTLQIFAYIMLNLIFNTQHYILAAQTEVKLYHQRLFTQ